MTYKDYKLRRLQKGMTQVDVALAVGVSLSSVVWWESGAQKPSEKNRKKLEEVLK